MIDLLKTPSIHWRAIKVALIVGTLLCLINHGDALLNGTMTQGRWLKASLTYLVPYGVSLYSAVMTLHKSQNRV